MALIGVISDLKLIASAVNDSAPLFDRSSGRHGRECPLASFSPEEGTLHSTFQAAPKQGNDHATYNCASRLAPFSTQYSVSAMSSACILHGTPEQPRGFHALWPSATRLQPAGTAPASVLPPSLGYKLRTRHFVLATSHQV